MSLNALKIHQVELTQAKLTQGRLESGADLTLGGVEKNNAIVLDGNHKCTKM